MKVWVTRAEPGASATAGRLVAMGRTPLVAPLLAVRPLPFPSLPTEVGAVAFTSANAVAALTGRPELQRLRALPVFAVGDATAWAARDLGFERVRSAGGDLAALGRLIAAHRNDIRGPVLHLAARERAGELADGGGPVVVTPVYEVLELPLDDAVRSAWTELDAVLVHSPRAARALARAAAALDVSTSPPFASRPPPPPRRFATGGPGSPSPRRPTRPPCWPGLASPASRAKHRPVRARSMARSRAALAQPVERRIRNA